MLSTSKYKKFYSVSDSSSELVSGLKILGGIEDTETTDCRLIWASEEHVKSNWSWYLLNDTFQILKRTGSNGLVYQIPMGMIAYFLDG